MKQLHAFLDLATTMKLNDHVANKTIELRRKHRKLKIGDAIIAATAIFFDLTLITRNIADFKKIEGLTIIDPHEL